MATRETIEINFMQAMRQADRIEALADDLNKVSGEKFGGSLQNLAGIWKGEKRAAGENERDGRQSPGGSVRYKDGGKKAV